MPHTYKSSFRFTTLSPITKEDLRKAKHIISHIIDNPESADFRERVNWEGKYPIMQPWACSTTPYSSLIPWT
jgi:CRISPR/Cas system endoribonuclease Cas6 (RAMP superfamily)